MIGSLAGGHFALDPELLNRACALLDGLARHHPESFAHSLRVARVTMAMWRTAPRRLGCGPTALLGSALHDVGKLEVPLGCLASGSPLAPEGRRLVQAHAAAGASLLARLGFPPEVVAVAAHHHERWEGGGYPTGRPAVMFAPVVRAVAVADAFTAMTEPGRPYRRPLSREAARRELMACRGRHFEPEAVELLLGSLADGIEARRAPAGAKRGRPGRLLAAAGLAGAERALALAAL